MNKVCIAVGSLAIVLCLIVLAYNVDTAAKMNKPLFPLSELQAQVVALQAQVAELKRFADETVPLVVGSMKRIDEISANHNKLIDAMQKVDAQNDYETALIGRSLRNYLGQSKWEKMLQKSSKEFEIERAAVK
jgi:hypothetical protein